MGGQERPIHERALSVPGTYGKYTLLKTAFNFSKKTLAISRRWIPPLTGAFRGLPIFRLFLLIPGAEALQLILPLLQRFNLGLPGKLYQGNSVLDCLLRGDDRFKKEALEIILKS